MTVALHQPARPGPIDHREPERRPMFDPRWRRWGRYAATSVVATAVSEATLLVLYGTHVLSASVAAIAASVAGTAPSYAMSRFWIWPEADRRRPARQAAGFWVVGLVSLGLSSLLTGVATANAPSGHLAHLVVAATAYVGTYGALWILKFVVYQRFLFRLGAASVTGPRPTPDG